MTQKNIVFNKKTECVQIIAPASGPASDQSNALQDGVTLLRNLGFQVNCRANLLTNNSSLSFFSDTLENRLNDFIDALYNPLVKVIWCFRGGYGSLEVALSYLQILQSKTLLSYSGPCTSYSTLPCDKVIIGFSDVTALLHSISQFNVLLHGSYAMYGIHGNVLTSLVRQCAYATDIINLLSGIDTELSLVPLNRHGYCKIHGLSTGGNLMTLASMCGTDLSPCFKDRIILLEDFAEPGRKVHRALLQLKDAIDQAAAVVFCDFTESIGVDPVILDFASKHHVPCFRVNSIGHGERNIPFTYDASSIIYEHKLIINSPFVLIS